MSRARFEAASDGVFAIAITLLVLGLSVPMLQHATDAALARSLLQLWPNYVAYGLSFAVVGIMWNNHHMLFRCVENIDRKTFFLNLLLLGITSFIPFATAVLGAYSSLRPAALLYGLTLTAASITYNGLLHYLISNRSFNASVSQRTLRDTIFHYRVGLFVYVLATVLAFAFPLASLALYWGITIYYLFPRGVDADAAVGNP